MKKIFLMMLTLSLLFVGCNDKSTTKNESTEKGTEKNTIVCTGTTEGMALGSFYNGATLEWNETYEFDEDDKLIYEKREMKVYYYDEEHKEILLESYEQTAEDETAGTAFKYEDKGDYILRISEIDYNVYNPEDIGLDYLYKDEVIEQAEFLTLVCK